MKTTLWILLTVFAVGLRLARYQVFQYPLRDSIAYVNFAKCAALNSWEQAGREIPAVNVKPPLFCAVMALGEKAGFGAADTGRMAVLLCGMGFCFAMTFIAKELWHKETLTLAVFALAAVYPAAVRYSAEIMSENLYWCFVGWAVFFAVLAENRENLYWWSCFGIFSSLAVMTRREGVELLLIFAVWLLISGWKRDAWQKVILKKAAAAMIAGICFACLLVPAAVLAKNAHSAWQPLQSRSAAYYIKFISNRIL